jgi:hypothetical protein
MKDCNCKKNVNYDELTGGTDDNLLVKYLFKALVFIILLVISPFIYLYMLYMMFNAIVLNKSIDVKPALLKLGNIFKTKEENDEEELDIVEYNNLTDDDVVLLNAEEVK